MQPKLATKSEFAAMINVTPGRVSQFIAAGQISAAAIVGRGQRAKIDIERAKADLRLTLDVGQRFGNGLATNLGEAPDIAPATASESGKADRGLDFEIKSAKLEQIRRVNRNAAIEDAKQKGFLIETTAARAEMGRIAGNMLNLFEGAMPTMAAKVSEKFGVPMRDVRHLMSGAWREIRAEASIRLAAHAATLPETVETVIEIADEEQPEQRGKSDG